MDIDIKKWITGGHVADTAIDYLEQNYKQTYANMIQSIKTQYEAAEKYRYEMREAVEKLREHAKGNVE